MNLGQTLVAVLALVLLVTIAVNINRARLGAIAATVDNLVDQEAINFGQNIIERVTLRAQSDADYNNLEANFHNAIFEDTFDSGRTLYASTEVVQIDNPEGLPYGYKKVTVSVFSDSLQVNLRSQYTASFIPWWKVTHQ
ncbi:MAG: hypothetical protein K0B81_09150 [Candidatus Cloacimonetes bacterium]|nr:hypothetical protein [Candidatus Cloacimonadota bacterium]